MDFKDIAVIIPSAGFGTRLLPGSKSITKEMFTIVNTPAIGYIAEEIKNAGLKNIILITAKNKDSILDYFDHHQKLETLLINKGKSDALNSIVEHLDINVVAIRQKEALGTGHAVFIAKQYIHDKPFAVILPDMLIMNGGKYMEQMLNIYRNTGKGVIALMKVDKEKVSSYGIVKCEEKDGLLHIDYMIEKPQINEAPSNLAIVGRYILPNRTFDLLKNTAPGINGEIQLTDALKVLAKEEGLIGIIIEDEIHDMGNPLGFLKANVSFGLKHPVIGNEFKDFLLEYLG